MGSEMCIRDSFIQVAALSGDARRCLDICRRAVEIAETQNESKEQTSQNNNNNNFKTTTTTRRKSSAKGVLKDNQKSTTDANNNTQDNQRVGMKHVEMALKEMFSSPKILALQSLSLMEEMFMKAIISEFRRSGLCLLYTSPSPRDGLLSRMPSSA